MYTQLFIQPDPCRRVASSRHAEAGQRRGALPPVRERGSAPKGGLRSTIFYPTKCICAVAA